MAELDELFGGGEGAPRVRSARILALLIGGVFLSLFGLACTAAPGGVLVLLAWMVVEQEMDRVDNGYLSPDQRPTVKNLRRACFAGLLLSIGVFFVQGWVLGAPFYEALWGAGLRMLAGGSPPS